jgi:hypothetical protein
MKEAVNVKQVSVVLADFAEKKHLLHTWLGRNLNFNRKDDITFYL